MYSLLIILYFCFQALTLDLPPRINWVFAIDSSKSMIVGERWNEIKGLMDDIKNHLDNKKNQLMTVYTYDTRAALPQSSLQNPSFWNSNKLPVEPSGKTSYGNALIRAIQYIKQRSFKNNCFVMISDGGSKQFPSNQIQIFNVLQNQYKKKNKKLCVLCYFIRLSNFYSPPPQFQRLCSSIGAIEIKSNNAVFELGKFPQFRTQFRKYFEQQSNKLIEQLQKERFSELIRKRHVN